MSSPTDTGERSLRILHVVSRSHRRGAELVATELADELDRRGHRNRLVALSPAVDSDPERVLTPLVTSPRVGRHQLLPLAWRLRRLLADEPVDVVMAHGGWPAQAVALAAPRRGPLLVWQRILGFPDKIWGPVRRRWWATVARRFDAAVALTGDLAEELHRLGFGGRVWVIPNSRKPERFLGIDRPTAARELRGELDVPADVPLLGFVGHLVHQKRPERAVEVVALLRAQGRDVHLVVAGDGPLRRELEVLAVSRGVAASVSFLGHRPDVESVLGGVDVAVLTSDAEGIPGVAIEALMAGCPMVSVPVGGVDEVVDHGLTGLVVEDHHPASMATAVAGLLDDEAVRSAMSSECRRRAHRFTASDTAAVYAERLIAAVAERTIRPRAVTDGHGDLPRA